MVNRFIAMVARVWSVMRGFRPFLIGPRPFGDRFPEKGFWGGTPSGESVRVCSFIVSPVGFLH